ncbi:MAG: hypothetical protein KDB00_07280 [Planctomycetales bacterium]|nr:hypothetical protein [Planctomycetales bacterium]
MSQSAEIEFHANPVESGLVDDVVALGPADFQRIGIQPKETRLDVIRRAASRAAKSLARRQLDAPNPITEEQLSRIAVSTYRLLDPRQREDRQSRAHVGRIRPHALYQAGRTEFAEGRISIQCCESFEPAVLSHHSNEMAHASSAGVSGDEHVAAIDDDQVAGVQSPTVNRVIQIDEIFPIVNASALPVGRARRLASHPAVILAMIMMLLLTAVAIWYWGQTLRTWPSRLVPEVS